MHNKRVPTWSSVNWSFLATTKSCNTQMQVTLLSSVSVLKLFQDDSFWRLIPEFPVVSFVVVDLTCTLNRN